MLCLASVFILKNGCLCSNTFFANVHCSVCCKGKSKIDRVAQVELYLEIFWWGMLVQILCLLKFLFTADRLLSLSTLVLQTLVNTSDEHVECYHNLKYVLILFVQYLQKYLQQLI